MNNNLELYLMIHQEKLQEVERRNQRHLHSRSRRQSGQSRQSRRFELRRLLFFL